MNRHFPYQEARRKMAHTSRGKPTTIAPAALTTTPKPVKARELKASETIPKANDPAAAAPPSMVVVTRR